MSAIDELQTTRLQLPDTIEDLSEFVLVNEERVQALRAQIRAIKKVHLAKEVYEQKLAEAQEIGKITVEAAQKMGELLLQIQTAQGRRTDLTSSDGRTKSQQLEEIGVSRQRSNEYEQMAQNPEAVQAAIQKAIYNGDVVSRSQVMKEIRAIKEELEAERRRREEAESRPPEIKEVVPPDYEALKARVESQSKEGRRLTDEYHALQTENTEQKARIKQLEEREGIKAMQDKLEREAEYFDMHITNFIGTVGGYVWITERLGELPEDKRLRVIQNIRNINAWTQQLLTNIGGGLNE